MTSSIPTPVAAALGLVPTVLHGVRRLPGKVVQLPILAVSSALSSMDLARRGYDDLAERGERLIARLRGVSVDELEDRVEDALAATGFAKPYDRVEDTLEDAADTVRSFVSSTVSGINAIADRVPDLFSTVPDDTVSADTVSADTAPDNTVPPAEAAKGVPTPKATEPDSTRVTTAAGPEVVATVEQVSSVIGGEILEHDQLPLPDFDHLTLGAVRGRLRSLDIAQLVQLRDYEKAKANRLPIVTMLDNRIAKLATDPTATLSGGDPAAPAAGRSAGAKGGSKVSPATAGPAAQPAPHVLPTHPTPESR